jgi:hypothetical protein
MGKAVGIGGCGQFTSHILLSLIDNESIPAVLLLFLVWLFILMSVDNNPDLLNSN